MNSSLGDVTPRNVVPLFIVLTQALSDNEGIPAEQSVLVRVREQLVTKHKVDLNMKNISFGLE